MDLEIALVHKYLGLGEFDQGVLADLLARAHHQQMQNVQRPTAQLDGSVVPHEDPPARNEPEPPERKVSVNYRVDSHRFRLATEFRLHDEAVVRTLGGGAESRLPT